MTSQGIPITLMNEIEHFFQVYKDLEGHKVSTEGFENRAAADVVIDEARNALRGERVLAAGGSPAAHGGP